MRFRFRFMVFNATFNNISVISWRSVLLMKETGVPGENHRPVASYWQTLSHNVVSSSLRHELLELFMWILVIQLGRSLLSKRSSDLQKYTINKKISNNFKQHAFSISVPLVRDNHIRTTIRCNFIYICMVNWNKRKLNRYMYIRLATTI